MKSEVAYFINQSGRAKVTASPRNMKWQRAALATMGYQQCSQEEYQRRGKRIAREEVKEGAKIEREARCQS